MEKVINHADLDKAYELVNEHNKAVANNPNHDEARDRQKVYALDITGRHGVYYTMWRSAMKNGMHILVYLGNAAEDLLPAVHKLLSRCPAHIRAEIVNDDQTRAHVRGLFKFKFGKYRGMDFDEVFQVNPGYFLWLTQDTEKLYKYNKPEVVDRLLVLREAAEDEITRKNTATVKSAHVGPTKGRTTFTFKVTSSDVVGTSYGTVTKYKGFDKDGNRYHIKNLHNAFGLSREDFYNRFIVTDTPVTVVASVNHSEYLGIKHNHLKRCAMPKGFVIPEAPKVETQIVETTQPQPQVISTEKMALATRLYEAMEAKGEINHSLVDTTPEKNRENVIFAISQMQDEGLNYMRSVYLVN